MDNSTDAAVPAPQTPLYDLIALEICLDLTALYKVPYEPIKNEKIDKDKSEKERKKILQQRERAAAVLASKLPKSLPHPEFHQLIGIFNSTAERCPNNLDCGLFEWEYFAQHHVMLFAEMFEDDSTMASQHSQHSALTAATGATANIGPHSMINPGVPTRAGSIAPSHLGSIVPSHLTGVHDPKADRSWDPPDPKTGK